MISGAITLFVLCCLSSQLSATATPRVAIVGAGVGGSTAAYYLSRAVEDVEITVFSSSPVGGRLKVLELAGRKYESGGSIIHNTNKYMLDMLELCQLQKKKPLAKETFSLGQKNIVFQEWGFSLLDKLRLALSYGPLQLWKLERFYLGVLQDFLTIYQQLDSGAGFHTVEDLLTSMGPDVMSLTRVSLQDHLLSLGIQQETISHVVSAATKFNYGQLPGAVHSLLGAISLIGFDKQLWAVGGGNQQVCHCALSKSGARLVNTSVSAVERVGGAGGFKVVTDSEEAEAEQYFDVVIVAAPLTKDKSSLQLRGLETLTTPGLYHRTVSTLVRGQLNLTTLGVTEDHHSTSHYIFVSGEVPFWSVELMTPVDYDPDSDEELVPVYRLFSHFPLSQDTISAVFSSVLSVTEEDWLAYPLYSTNDDFSTFQPSPGLFYLNRIEWAASAMEMSVIGAKNVVNLSLASSCVTMSKKDIYYSDKYTDDKFEYRHVMLPKDLAKLVPKTHLMAEAEWRNLGVQQSLGWVHYMLHEPEPHILLFRRPRTA